MSDFDVITGPSLPLREAAPPAEKETPAEDRAAPPEVERVS